MVTRHEAEWMRREIRRYGATGFACGFIFGLAAGVFLAAVAMAVST